MSIIHLRDRGKAEFLVKEAKHSISDFCLTVCKAYCCRKGFLPLDKSNVDTVLADKKKEIQDLGLLQIRGDGKFALQMGTTGHPCPSLQKDLKCRVYNQKEKPLACERFPFYVEEDTLKVAHGCLAVREGKFYPATTQILKLGFTLEQY